MSAPATTRLTCTVDEVAELLGISRGKAYECVKAGQLRSVQIGRRILVPRTAIDEFLAGKTKTAADERAPLTARREPPWRTIRRAR
jgi:excisionase family DNA binding protein